MGSSLLVTSLLFGAFLLLNEKRAESFNNFTSGHPRIAAAYFFLVTNRHQNIRKIKGKYWGYLIYCRITLENGIFLAVLFTTASKCKSVVPNWLLNSLVSSLSVLIADNCNLDYKLRIKRFAGVLL